MPGRIPGFDVLPPDREQQFQTFMAFDPNVRAWRNSFQTRYGEAPDINSHDFDYRRAWQYGARPEPHAADGGFPHWPSGTMAPPYAGDVYFKAPDHETMWKQRFFEQFGGADPDTVQQWTPEMQQFMQRQLSGLPKGGLF